MDQKKQIIIDEILYWKKNKLIPEVYCNFLLSLYSEGKFSPTEAKVKKKSSFSVEMFLFLAIAFGLVALSFVVIYFTEFSSTMQMAFQFLFLLSSLFIAKHFYCKGERIAHVYVIITTFMSFLLVLEIGQFFFPKNPFLQGVSIALLSLSWAYAGWKWKFLYLLIAGVTGIFSFFLFLFMNGQ